jgi:hypothetical protein
MKGRSSTAAEECQGAPGGVGVAVELCPPLLDEILRVELT